MDRKSEIEEKCDQAGCDDKHREKHLRLYLYDQWDCHPPPTFTDWLRTVAYPSEPKMDPITAWNSDHDRQAFGKWLSDGQPPTPVSPTSAELSARFHAAMAKIESRFSRGHEVVTEDTRLKGYDKR